jgi:hypothetical protein
MSDTVRYAKEQVDAVHDAAWQAGVLAGRVDTLNKFHVLITQLITVDYAGPYDDTRGLVALLAEVEARLNDPAEAAPTQAAGSPG